MSVLDYIQIVWALLVFHLCECDTGKYYSVGSHVNLYEVWYLSVLFLYYYFNSLTLIITMAHNPCCLCSPTIKFVFICSEMSETFKYLFLLIKIKKM
ncbi:uncharacterized protein DS421_3g88810 [Arachis hypogaea]|nr:uncharacterized protein DS421_3g88810 [Arachis hypogaea]